MRSGWIDIWDEMNPERVQLYYLPTKSIFPPLFITPIYPPSGISLPFKRPLNAFWKRFENALKTLWKRFKWHPLILEVCLAYIIYLSKGLQLYSENALKTFWKRSKWHPVIPKALLTYILANKRHLGSQNWPIKFSGQKKLIKIKPWTPFEFPASHYIHLLIRQTRWRYW